MQILCSTSRKYLCFLVVALSLVTAGDSSVQAATAGVSATVATPLLAKSWLIGYSLVGLGILLGLLAVAIPSMRKTIRKKEG